MKKNGFTLIELLAVIVILAAIALIATPLIMKVVNEARDSTIKSSVKTIKNSAENFMLSELALNPGYTFNIDDFTFGGNQFGKGTSESNINIVLNGDNRASVAVYDNNKCYYILATESAVTVENGLDKQACLEKAGTTEIVEGDPLLPQIEANLCTSTITSECYKNEGNEYVYTGASGTVGNNWLWYGGHLWRIIKVDKTTGRYTLITSYPATTISWGSDDCITNL